MYEQAAQQTLHDRGGTFTRDGLPVETHFLRGFLVGGLIPTVTLPEADAATLASALVAYVAGNAPNFNARPGLFLGTWVHENRVYLDVTEYISDRGHAVRTAQGRGELAIWDCYHGNAIATTPED